MAIATQIHAQEAPVRLGPGVTAPRLIRKMEAEFSPLARAEHIQGTVVLQLVVTEKGRAGDIQVISPLGYELDERAIAAIQQWEFVPGQRNGVPVPVRAVIEVNFRFLGTGFDESYERRRTEYNLALRGLRRDDQKAREQAAQTMLKLANQKFPAAVYVVGLWEATGENAAVARNPVDGWVKIEQAAKKNYGPAMYQLAQHALAEGTTSEKTWDTMRRAAVLGSLEAQYLLGDRHERGEGLERSRDRAKNYFRLCAAGGVPKCQYRLARLMFDAPNRPDYEYEQALAWFSLAADQGVSEAREVVERETPNLSPAQDKTIATLKRQLVRPQ